MLVQNLGDTLALSHLKECSPTALRLSVYARQPPDIYMVFHNK
jgi:hypothetical protein